MSPNAIVDTCRRSDSGQPANVTIQGPKELERAAVHVTLEKCAEYLQSRNF